MNEEQILALGGIVAGLALYMLRRRPQRVRQHDSIRTGVIFTRELMETRNKARFLAVTRMTRECFRNLCRLLISEKGGLKALHTISIEEKIMMYIQVLKGQSIRVICPSTVSHIIHEVSAALMRCESQLIPKPNGGTLLSDKIRNDSKFYPFFDNCDGAIDGTHIPAVIPLIDQGVYRNRKKFISQNVLGVCNFEMIFTHALTGWEGSAHDGKVLADAKLKGLPMRAGMYYLADAGYALRKLCLVPYRGV